MGRVIHWHTIIMTKKQGADLSFSDLATSGLSANTKADVKLLHPTLQQWLYAYHTLVSNYVIKSKPS